LCGRFLNVRFFANVVFSKGKLTRDAFEGTVTRFARRGVLFSLKTRFLAKN
jgi:hypothetical protein